MGSAPRALIAAALVFGAGAAIGASLGHRSAAAPAGLESPQPPVVLAAAPPLRRAPGAAAPAQEPRPAWQRNAAAHSDGQGRPRIVVVLDDVGVHVPNGWRAVALPGPLTLALMTYAHDLDRLSAAARARGHELLVHVPMEPGDASWNPGPNPLALGLDPADLRRRIDWALGRFDGAVGINNHMGSRFTADAGAMAVLMEALAGRGMLFLDSLTTGASKGRSTSRAAGVPYLARDVFLDNEPDPESVWARIGELERIARRDGSAIAIAHPKGATLQVLQEWLPTLAGRGFVLVPLSALVPPPAAVVAAGG